MRMGVVADDLTGSHDIGSMFAKAGYVADVYSFDESDFSIDPTNLDACILNTSSRLDSAQVTNNKVLAATRALQRTGCKQYFAKTSSAFVGPVGAQFDAMLDALGEEFAIVVVGFPKNGRTTIDGVHYIHGKKLEDSEFRSDPAHPMTSSNLVDILQAQTSRRVGLIDHTVISQGVKELESALQSMRGTYNYIVLDVVDQAALATIARAVADARVLCGSSALAEELPAVWGVSPNRATALSLPESNELGVLCAAGSLMPQTVAQIRHLRSLGVAPFELNTLALFQSRTRQVEVERLASALECRLRNSQNVVVHTPNRQSKVDKTRMAGESRGMSRTEVARLVSETLAEVVGTVRHRCGVTRIVVAGGETSAAVCARLSVKGMRVLHEIQPGLPSCLSLGEEPLLLVLKSGSFGSPDFLERAIDHLQALGAPVAIGENRQHTQPT